MTPDQINALAREYAIAENEDMYYDDPDLPECIKNKHLDNKAEEYANFLQWLSGRYTIVEKDVIINKHNACKIGEAEVDSPECGFMNDLLEDILPELLKPKERPGGGVAGSGRMG